MVERQTADLAPSWNLALSPKNTNKLTTRGIPFNREVRDRALTYPEERSFEALFPVRRRPTRLQRPGSSLQELTRCPVS